MQLEQFKSRVLEHLPKKPYCSDDKTARLIRTQRLALKEPYIQLNSHLRCAWLVFDIDVPFQGVYAWELHGLPPPNYIALSKDSRKYHMAYAISPVYTSENARAKPLAYLAAIQRTYKRLLGSDQGFAHLMTKNPLHSDWLVTVFHNHEYSLAELHDGCGDLDKKEFTNVAELDDYERNVSMFNALRYHSYAVVHHYSSHGDLHAHLEHKAEELNQQFSDPLDFNELMGIPKSVAKWTWRNRNSIRVKERKMQLDESQPLETRQALGAYYSHDVRKEATQERIAEAVAHLKANGIKVTQKAITTHSGVSKNTLTKYKDLIKSLK
ncbi:replication initiation protein [Vibrio cholerae]